MIINTPLSVHEPPNLILCTVIFIQLGVFYYRYAYWNKLNTKFIIYFLSIDIVEKSVCVSKLLSYSVCHGSSNDGSLFRH